MITGLAIIGTDVASLPYRPHFTDGYMARCIFDIAVIAALLYFANGADAAVLF